MTFEAKTNPMYYDKSIEVVRLELKELTNLFDDYASSRFEILVLVKIVFLGYCFWKEY